MPRYINDSDYWLSDDEEYPYEDAMGIFRWATTKTKKKIRIHEGYSIGECYTMYNAYARIQAMVKNNPKYQPYTSHYIEFEYNTFFFDIMKDGRATITGALITIEDELTEEVIYE